MFYIYYYYRNYFYRFVDEENCYDCESRWLPYCSTICLALDSLLFFTYQWTYSMGSELQLSTGYVQYGFSTYLIVISAVISLLSMSLVLWRIVRYFYLFKINIKNIIYL
jgi:hypothetical protein